MSKQGVFDYYSSSENVFDCARWLVFIRCFAYVRTPACIYSKMKTPSSMRSFRTTHVVPVPDYISNILVEQLNIHSAREAAIAGQSKALDVMVKDLLIDQGVLPFRDRVISSTFKPWGVEPYGLSKQTVLSIDETMVSLGVGALGVAPGEMREMVVRCASAVGVGPIEPGPLRKSELDWVTKHGGRWLWGLLDERSWHG